MSTVTRQPGESTGPRASAAAGRARDLSIEPGELSNLCDAAAADFTGWVGGDGAALDRLVHRMTPILWHIVRAYRLDQATAEDAVQTTWMALVRKADSIADPQAVVRWLCVTARREAWRAAGQHQRAEPHEDDVLDLRAAETEGPEAAVVRDHRDAALWAAVGRLTERCQRLLRIVAFSERPDYNGLSGTLGMPVGSIGPTRGRCLAKLRSLLGDAVDWRTT